MKFKEVRIASEPGEEINNKKKKRYFVFFLIFVIIVLLYILFKINVKIK